MEPTTELTDVQLKVIEFVARSLSIFEAANQADTTWKEVTLWRNTNPAFCDALEEAMRERAIVNQERIQGLAFEAIQVLGKVLKDERASPAIRLRAAQTVFKMTASAKKPQPEPQDTETQDPEKTEIMHNSAQSTVRLPAQPGRNSLCPCGSGIKFKRCCANPVPQALPTAA